MGLQLKICIVVPSLSGGGAEFVAREWAAWLVSQGDAVTVALTHPKKTDIRPVGADIVNLGGDGPLAHVQAIRRLVRCNRFDAVIGLLPYFNLLAVLAGIGRIGKRRPKVFISGRNVEVPFPHVHGKSFRLTRAISKILYPLADGYIAISHPVAAEAGALYGIKSNKMRVVPNPATAKVQAWQKAADTAGSKLGQGVHEQVEGGVLNLIVPARLADQKRPLVAVEAARLLSNSPYSFSKVVLHFFGDGPLRAEVERGALDAGVEARFHGWVEEWFAAAPTSGVVLLTSLAEGFGNVLVEAAAIGLPSVVSSRCLGSADAVVPGITGEFAAGDAPRDYAEAISKAAGLPLDQASLGSWLERFSPETSGKSLRDYLASVIG
ncbi:glycosyltransferase [Arthrobacter sp. 162MFSha1.1]|uniref:glycosyltransferase n=1 Tax=Arthrobacter sp. 162MFSha1.1 TaxID=1151119 RepID=UPI0009DA97E2|nr:glycosyltransferase [Arthrobacter sp. 162MFSha1.1]